MIAVFVLPRAGIVTRERSILTLIGPSLRGKSLESKKSVYQSLPKQRKRQLLEGKVGCGTSPPTTLHQIVCRALVQVHGSAKNIGSPALSAGGFFTILASNKAHVVGPRS